MFNCLLVFQIMFTKIMLTKLGSSYSARHFIVRLVVCNEHRGRISKGGLIYMNTVLYIAY